MEHLPERGDSLSRSTVSCQPIGPLAQGIRISPDYEEMVEVPGGRIYVRVNGDIQSSAPLICINGGPGSAHWQFLNATSLADDRAVILYDQLDCGKSEHPGDPANWHIARFLRELEAIRVRFDIDSWHVLGASWGGTLAIEYGSTRPSSLLSLIVQSPLISTDVWLRDARTLKDAMPAAIRATLDSSELECSGNNEALAAAINAFYERHVHLTTPPPEIAAYRDLLPESFSSSIYNHMWGPAEFSATGTLRDYDGTHLLRQLDGLRTMFIAGEHDEALPSTVEEFAHALPGSVFHCIPRAAHLIMRDNPNDYLAVLRSWLASHD